MKRIPIIKIQAVRDGSLMYHTKKITCPDDAAEIVREYMDKNCQTDRENLIELCLNTKNVVIGINLVSVGTLNSSVVHPREIFKAALLANAAHIIIAHNHPSGNPELSSEDKEITRRIQEAGEILGISVMDHIVVGDGFRSFKNMGLL